MSFLTFILKNPFRNKTRSALAIVGIAIGIATIIALGIVTDGLKESTQNTLKSGGSDFTVTEANSPGLMSSKINSTRVDELKNLTGVEDAVGVLLVNRVVDGDLFSVMGIKKQSLKVGEINIIEGREFNENSNEIIIGKRASQSLNKTVGDTINLFNRDFKVVGVFETGSMWEDAGSFMSLSLLQELAEKPDEVSMIFVKIKPEANLEEVTSNVESKYPQELVTIKTIEDFNRVNKGLDTIDTASWAISLLAILIGGIGVVNTMVMSVYERTREIGVLKASGWKNRRIMAMIMGESVVLTLVSYVIGLVMGVGAVELILSSPAMGNFIQPVYSWELFLKALGIAFLVGLVGGLYPAFRASRLAPTEALRYE
ncbi:MAG: ABC transporter permease [Methanobacterium formicicum]|jgi:putative ABC transport system permease protein|uniref:ABC transporter permease n=1 Tax=Methanobacterium formicicum TaxID=2162 RepID=A0A843AEW4_METFO|nr:MULTISPECIES: ABC transporter permease [Methanobacterium]MBF4474062.1 ABC transporter permease [Methanobacterium formicicum]MDD4809652.1 ABC transporter permease [Methanobacterium formicicum]